MQTFLPLPDFAESARVLDWRRLGKQRVEAWMLHDMLTNPNTRFSGWLHHPALEMWRGYDDALSDYFWTMVAEWKRRGYRSTITLPIAVGDHLMPPWLGDPEFHASHRSNLLRKDPIWYGQFGWIEQPDRPYVWPKS
ncbi:MAG TPA: MSMEG_6728 family protein [Longimicrobiaceae bacterium]|nr:MSMEG_6728 family protein [Longimicrobiaceae bacterium]